MVRHIRANKNENPGIFWENGYIMTRTDLLLPMITEFLDAPMP
jgi:hypothetical protein